MKTQHILAPVDGSEMSHFALGEADSLALQYGGKLTVMFVHTPATVHLMDDDFPEPEEMKEAYLATAQSIMDKWASSLATSEENRHVVIKCGSPVQTIIEHSKECDLIVMSTHGHTGFTHFHLGSVAERVIRGAHCDVLVVKQEETTDS